MFPQYRPDDYWTLTFKPYTTNRFKLNAFVDVRIDTNNIIRFNAGYVPQNDAEARKRTITMLGTELESGFQRTAKQNKLSASFQRLTLKGNLLVENAVRISDTVGTNTSYTIKDDMAYQFELGNLIVTPHLNLTYRKATDTSNLTYNAYPWL